jgi:BirA family biotin operon repressor/biotin-[acetyl-CoA-carboxylase] ligase
MFASYTHHTTWPTSTWSLMPRVFGLAMREAICDVADVDVRLKWPNDVMMGDKKHGGILVESSGSRITAGCGVNLWWGELVDGVAALYAQDPGPDSAQSLATAWVDRLREHLGRGPDDWRRDDYLAASATLGRSIVWGGGEGLAVDLAQDGALVVETADGTVSLHAGEVHTRTNGRTT